MSVIKNTINIPTMERKASLGWYAILCSAACVLGAGYFGILLPDYVMTRCGIQNNVISKVIGFSLSSLLAIHQFVAIGISRVEWSDTHIQYRAWNFKKYVVPVTDIVDVNYVSLAWAKMTFKNTPSFFYSLLSVELEIFNEFAYRTRLHSHPHEFYFPAERQVVYDGAKCGCMSCFTVFPKEHIQKWIGEIIGKALTKDRAVCPSCEQWEFVLTDQGKVLMTVPSLILAAKKRGLMEDIPPLNEINSLTANKRTNTIISKLNLTWSKLFSSSHYYLRVMKSWLIVGK